MWIFIIVFMILGFIGTISPRTSWYLSNWWKFRSDAEPGEASLILYRVGGIILILVSVFLIFKI